MTMSVSTTASGWGADATSRSGSLTGAQGQRPGGGGPLADAAKALGMSGDEVRSALTGGQSLDDLAAAKGMPHEDLVDALKANMPNDLRNSGQADAVAERMASTKGLDAVAPAGGASGADGVRGSRPAGLPPGRPPGPPPGGSGESTGVLGSRLTESQSGTLEALAALLDTDSESLLDPLTSGTSLADLVQGAGLDGKALSGIVQDGLLFDARL